MGGRRIPDFDMALARRVLREERERLGFTIQGLAAAADVSPSTIQSIEGIGAIVPSVPKVTTIATIARVLGWRFSAFCRYMETLGELKRVKRVVNARAIEETTGGDTTHKGPDHGDSTPHRVPGEIPSSVLQAARTIASLDDRELADRLLRRLLEDYQQNSGTSTRPPRRRRVSPRRD